MRRTSATGRCVSKILGKGLLVQNCLVAERKTFAKSSGLGFRVAPECLQAAWPVLDKCATPMRRRSARRPGLDLSPGRARAGTPEDRHHPRLPAQVFSLAIED